MKTTITKFKLSDFEIGDITLYSISGIATHFEVLSSPDININYMCESLNTAYWLVSTMVNKLISERLELKLPLKISYGSKEIVLENLFISDALDYVFEEIADYQPAEVEIRMV